MAQKKGMTELSLGPTGWAVADALRFYRTDQGLTYKELNERLVENGKEIPTLGLRRIEARARRVDVDELIALAYALDVSPIDMLTRVPEHARVPNHQIATSLPADVSFGELAAWIRGQTKLSLTGRVEYLQRETERLKGEVDRYEQQVQDMKKQLIETPNDEALLNRLHWAQGEAVMTTVAHARASDTLEVLQARQASEEDSSSE